MFPSLSRAQRPRKHFESEGALAKRGTFVYDQNQTILCRSQAERKFLKIWNLYNVGNGLYRVFTTAKRALSFQQKRAFIQEILFSFCKWGTLAQKGTFFTFKKVGGGGQLRVASLRVASLRVASLRFASLRWGFIASKTLT